MCKIISEEKERQKRMKTVKKKRMELNLGMFWRNVNEIKLYSTNFEVYLVKE